MTEIVMTPDNGVPDDEQITLGDTFTGFLEEVVSDDARDAVRASAIEVLTGALEVGPGSTGLIVGRVQSGKTLSYEGVISLARDNGFSLVIVISGISNPLLAQGERRLKGDLGAADRDGWLFVVPNDKQQSLEQIEQALDNVQANWRNPSTPQAYKQTAVVVLLKHHGGILSFTDLFARVPFDGQRVLIVDDEADQVSLNTLVKRGKKSSTYENLLALRQALPDHYYLQYTATPQAPLLITIEDRLSPDFVRVLEPGVGYTGGDRYFSTANKLVKTIRAEDLAAADHPNGPPPGGLRQAMLEFLVGAAHVVVSGKPKTRSMLVHPSRQKDAHADFVRWIAGMKKDWQDKYEHAAEVVPVKLRQEFQDAWTDLHDTFPDLASFAECWSALDIVFRNLNIVEVNTRRQGQTPVIDWSPTQSYILVGGQAIDRGFTVEGLTVTYMPRGPGTRTADTVQQRARFFGYKAAYLGLCRVYLEPDVRDDFVMYVLHEKDMLQSLRTIEAGESSLKEWKRQFLLDKKMRATRASVISIPTVHVKSHDRWISDTDPNRPDALPLAEVRARAEQLLAGATSVSAHGHRAGYITFTTALELLAQTSPESLLAEPNFQALLLNLSRLQDGDGSEQLVRVIWMRPNGAPADRQQTKDGGVQLFQGRNASGYAGDRAEFDPTAPLTIQLHQVRMLERKSMDPLGEYFITAWRIPEHSAVGWIVEVGD